MDAPISNVDEASQNAKARRVAFEAHGLSDHAYLQRRAMMVIAAATFAFVMGGFRLSGVDAFGFKIERVHERELLGFMCIVLIYVTGNFVVIARPEIVTLRSELTFVNADQEASIKRATTLMSGGLKTLRDLCGSSVVPQTPAMKTAQEELDQVEALFRVVAPGSLRSYRAIQERRIRWEFGFPVGIAVGVIVLTMARIAYVLYWQNA